MKKFDKKEIIERAVKTFIEGFLGSVTANFAVLGSFSENPDSIKTAIVSLLVGGISAGISLAWNMVFGPLFRIDKKDDANV